MKDGGGGGGARKEGRDKRVREAWGERERGACRGRERGERYGRGMVCGKMGEGEKRR